MRAPKVFGTVGVAAALTVAFIALGGAASAGPPLEHVKFHEETTETVEDFCDVPGLTVRLDRVLDGKFLAKTRGSDDEPFIVEHQTLHDVWTNPVNGNAVTVTSNGVAKIHELTVNPDGTISVIQLATGNFVAYGPDGKAIARNPGQVRVELLFDDAGTPDDPSDDVFLGVVSIVKESTGRSDDFCAAAVPVLTG
jgi:hypothetical protein